MSDPHHTSVPYTLGWLGREVELLGRRRWRDRVIEALSQSTDQRWRNEARVMGQCLTGGVIVADFGDFTGARAFLRMTRCERRACPVCAWHNTRKVRAGLQRRIEAAVARGVRPRFMTLPFARGWLAEGPKAAKDHAWRTFRKARQGAQWKARVAGGHGTYEHTGTAEGWLPHWHVVYEGAFWPTGCKRVYDRCPPEVQKAWAARMKRRGKRVPWRECDRTGVYDPTTPRRIGKHKHPAHRVIGEPECGPCLSCWWHEQTGDSYVVDCRAKFSVQELVKYLTKPSKDIPSTMIEQSVRELAGSHQFVKFGTWHGEPKPDEAGPAEPDPDDEPDTDDGAAWAEFALGDFRAMMRGPDGDELALWSRRVWEACKARLRASLDKREAAAQRRLAYSRTEGGRRQALGDLDDVAQLAEVLPLV